MGSASKGSSSTARGSEGRTPTISHNGVGSPSKTPDLGCSPRSRRANLAAAAWFGGIAGHA
eukprot:12909551-Prorocentrum_lima.AAC.1